MAARAATMLRALRARREALLNLVHGAPSPPLPPAASLRGAPPPHSATRGLVLRDRGGWGWVPSVASAPLARVQALRGTYVGVLGLVGDCPMLLRVSGRRASEEVLVALRRAARRVGGRDGVVEAGPRMLHCAGMGLTAAITREERDGEQGVVSARILRLLSSTKGPHRIGIGWLGEDMRKVGSAIVFHGVTVLVAYLAWMVPAAWPWVAVVGLVAYGTRPDLSSFMTFLKDRAPEHAKKKTEFLDRLRARIAPYLIGLVGKPIVSDYGVFSVVSVTDYADYVYVYFGFLSRWVLLGWYNAQDDYNFDKVTEGKA